MTIVNLITYPKWDDPPSTLEGLGIFLSIWVFPTTCFDLLGEGHCCPSPRVPGNTIGLNWNAVILRFLPFCSNP